MKKLALFLVALATLKFSRVALRYRNTYIRLSLSYLLRIKVDDRYLLVRNARFPYYQPVGGVFKRHPSSDRFLRKIRALNDDFRPPDQARDDDLRIRIPGKHLMKFMQWFTAEKERETSGWREFYEELVQPGYLPHNLFPYIHYQHIRRHEHPVRYSPYAQSPELLVADVYELIPTNEQEEFLRQRSREQHQHYIWVTEDKIRTCGVVPREERRPGISLHSQWIL